MNHPNHVGQPQRLELGVVLAFLLGIGDNLSQGAECPLSLSPSLSSLVIYFSIVSRSLHPQLHSLCDGSSLNLRGGSILPQSPSLKTLNLHHVGLGSSGYFCANLLIHKRKKALSTKSSHQRLPPWNVRLTQMATTSSSFWAHIAEFLDQPGSGKEEPSTVPGLLVL